MNATATPSSSQEQVGLPDPKDLKRQIKSILHDTPGRKSSGWFDTGTVTLMLSGGSGREFGICIYGANDSLQFFPDGEAARRMYPDLLCGAASRQRGVPYKWHAEGDVTKLLAAFAEVQADPLKCRARADERMRIEAEASEERRQQEKKEFWRKQNEAAKQRAVDESATIGRILKAVSSIRKRFPAVENFNLPTSAGKVARITAAELVYAKTITFGNLYSVIASLKTKDGEKYAHGDLSAFANDLEATAEDPLANARRLQRCMICARELTDDESRRRGYGPDCARTNHLPWGVSR